MVVGDHREFVGGHVVASPDDEIAKVDTGRPAHEAMNCIVKLDRAAVGHAETPGHVAGSRRAFTVTGPQARWKDRLGIGLPAAAGRGRRKVVVGRERRLLDVASRMGARIDRARRLEPSPDIEIPRRAGRLPIRAVWPADVGPLRPGQTEPVEVVECGDGELLPAPRLIEILDSHDEAGISRPCGSQRERAGVAHVEEARGGGSETSASGRGVGHGV